MTRTVWIVDAAYLLNVGRARPNGIDYVRLKERLEKETGEPIYEGHYLNSTPDPATDRQNAFHSWLKSAPPKGPKMRLHLYQLKNMHVTCPECSHPFDRQVQKGVDVGVATLLIKLAVQNVYNRLILTAGDGDLEDAIDYIKTDLKKEFWLNGGQNSLSTDLQSYADRVLWLDDMYPDIDRPTTTQGV
ncbi:NYN domain-containing protein [Pseudomonas aeruginosa]|uniref:NYN domain-containing protein n=1 Tax=Pseudomonas aeruginosa TaxID=287 RepID=UPI00071B742F|nr:NYN domain-containing protein [Pseudomonas aeruginosa]KSS26650.1 NYN domain-containing protein [Pseudomonas aeruginosa]HBO5286252.1 NYN domain-containing protein [Pseudomonas aeruginosa]HBO6089318.1 NYN domain-containing protein [Pseudomonas aeruginosa]